MKNSFAIIVASSPLWSAPMALAQNNHMMDGNRVGWMGGYGGMWLPWLLVCALVVGLIVWIVKRK